MVHGSTLLSRRSGLFDVVHEAVRRSNERIQELRRQLEEEGIDTAHITY